NKARQSKGDDGSIAPWPDPVSLDNAPELVPFPAGVLPRALEQLVQEISWAFNVPTDFAAVPLLVLASGAIGNSRHLAVSANHLQAPCLYAAIVGRPGTNKSGPLNLLRRPLDTAQRTFLQDWQRQKIAWEESNEDTRGLRPAPKRCIVSDVTT